MKTTNIKENTITVLIIVIVISFVIIMIILGYNHEWTGFGESSVTKRENTDYEPSKKLWDWLELLIIPIILTAGGFLFNRLEKRKEQFIADQRAILQEKAEVERFRENSLQSYIEFVTKLVIDGKLVNLDSEIKIVENENGIRVGLAVRSRTLSVLKMLDPRRKAIILQFLAELRIITIDNRIVILQGADFSGTDFTDFNLKNINLNGAVLTNSTFINSNLSQADLAHTNIKGSTFKNSNLEKSDLRGAILDKCVLNKIDFQGAKIDGATCQNSILKDINFGELEYRDEERNVKFIRTSLAGVNFSYSEFTNVKMDGSFMPLCKFHKCKFNNVSAKDSDTENVEPIEILEILKNNT